MTPIPPDSDRFVEPELSEEAARRWGRFWITISCGWLLLLGFVAGVGVLITGPLADSSLMQWDRTLPEDIEKTRTAMGEGWSLVGSSLGETLTVIAIATLVGIGFLIARRWASVLLLAAALLIEVSVFVATTLLVPRDRPNVEQLDVSPPTSSYPSGHTAAATALALSLAVLVGWNIRSTVVRWFVWIVAVLVGPIVAASRVYRGMHHPTDVAVGFLIGIASVVLAFLAVRAWVGSTAPRHRARESAELEKSTS